jgi:hypothetical protein
MAIRVGGAPVADPLQMLTEINRPPGLVTREPSTFRRILSGVLGGVGNIFMPGVGSALANIFSGSSDPYTFLKAQLEVQNQARIFELQSNIAKSRHDSGMAAIRNIRG